MCTVRRWTACTVVESRYYAPGIPMVLRPGAFAVLEQTFDEVVSARSNRARRWRDRPTSYRCRSRPEPRTRDPPPSSRCAKNTHDATTPEVALTITGSFDSHSAQVFGSVTSRLMKCATLAMVVVPGTKRLFTSPS